MPTLIEQIQRGAEDAFSFRMVVTVTLIAGAFIFFLNSNLPGAAQTRNLLGMSA